MNYQAVSITKRNVKAKKPYNEGEILGVAISATLGTGTEIVNALFGKLHGERDRSRAGDRIHAELIQLMQERDDLKFVTDIKPDADADFAKFEGRYFATPKKMGAQTAEANINAGIAAARQINAFFRDGDTKFQVNK